MALFPVIMCGGSGTRLWPASRPSRPKQFIALAGNRSLFQDTVERVQSLASDEGCLVIIAGVHHGALIEDQLGEIGVQAHVLLEPEARDSAAAMAAATAWVNRRDPAGMIVFVASDHYIPEPEAFRLAVRQAAEEGRNGRIVTLGIHPTEPSSAYGYIRPGGRGFSDVLSFHEKPDSETAARFIESGYLWNSGNFIVSAETLTAELQKYVPDVFVAVLDSLPPLTNNLSVQILGEAFLNAPKISIDYAVMERTQRASVLEVDFIWSDLGSWDSIAESGEGSIGARILEDAERVLSRAPDGILVAALGVRDLAIVVEKDAVLVCALNRSQEVKRIVDRIRAVSPQHIDFAQQPNQDLTQAARWLADWLRLRALPIWATLGLGDDGGFRETLTLSGQPNVGPRRTRVQARQIYVYAQAGILNWRGPWRTIIDTALNRFNESYVGPNGLSHAVLSADWSIADPTPALYDQAFVLLSLATATAAGIGGTALEEQALGLRTKLLESVLPNGTFKESGDYPYQSNAHMHLFEACLAWAEISTDLGWMSLADQIATVALNVFIDAEKGFLREFFNENWVPIEGEDGRLWEPGHQFEWAWLLTRYARATDNKDAKLAARRLYTVARNGILNRPPVATDAMNDDFTVRSRRARLWPQTEWLKAALILAEEARDGERLAFIGDAEMAFRALRLYLTDDGLWKDKRLPSGDFINEPSPASSFYHIMAAFAQLANTTAILDQDDSSVFNLS